MLFLQQVKKICLLQDFFVLTSLALKNRVRKTV